MSQESRKYLESYLSRDEIEDKVFYIPHPNYIGAYSEDTEPVSAPSNEIFTVLFIGQVRQYKNIELIIAAAKDLKELPVHFIIAGKPESQRYQEQLEEQVKGIEHIQFDFRFIEDDEIERMIRNSDIVVLPYDMQSSMNSGTAILAFSNRRTVICPLIASVMDIEEEIYYSYIYESREEHQMKLKEAVKRAYCDWKNDRAEYLKKGEALFDLVKENNSTEKITSCYQQLFQKLFG